MHAMKFMVKTYNPSDSIVLAKVKFVSLTTSITYGPSALIPAPQRRDSCATILAREHQASRVLVEVGRILDS